MLVASIIPFSVTHHQSKKYTRFIIQTKSEKQGVQKKIPPRCVCTEVYNQPIY